MGDLLGSSRPEPALPILTPPPVMPDQDDKKMKAARRRAAAGLTKGRGRDSTILSNSDADVLGG